MTIVSQTSRISYTGDGSTTVFAVPFYFSADADLVVNVQDLAGNVTTKILGTDYTLSGATITSGGSCTFTIAPTSGYIVAITRVPPITQTASYNNNDPFPAKSHELALDKATTVDQYLKGLIDRAILVAPTDVPPMTTLPPAAVRANKGFAFDSLGNPIAGVLPSSGTISSAMAPVVNSSTIAIARGLLGISDTVLNIVWYDSVTAASAATIPATQNMIRTAGFAAFGDGGGALYKRVGSQPSHSGKFQTVGGVWWEYVVDGPINVKQFGAKGDGSTANDTAFAAAWSVLIAVGNGRIYAPAGRYKLTSQFAQTLPNAKFTATWEGDGDGATVFYWPNGGGGMRFTWSNPLNTLHFRHISFTTGVVNGGVAVDLQSTFFINGSSIWNSFNFCSFHGDDGGGNTFYWTIGVRAHAVSEINFMGCNFYGGATGTGTGINVEGHAASAVYGVLYNVDKCFFNYNQFGFTYGDYVQGVTINACNFNGQVSTAGIYTAGSYAGIPAQLNVTNCQFDTGSNPILLNSAVDGVLIVGNTITVSNNNGVGIYMGASFLFQIASNTFTTTNSPTNVTGLVAGAPGTGTITGNVFKAMSLGYNLLSGTGGIAAIGNAFNAVTTKFVNSGGSNLVPGVATSTTTTNQPMP